MRYEHGFPLETRTLTAGSYEILFAAGTWRIAIVDALADVATIARARMPAAPLPISVALPEDAGVRWLRLDDPETLAVVVPAETLLIAERY